MGITQIFIILGISILIAVGALVIWSSNIRRVASLEMSRGILPKQMRELIKTVEKNRTPDAPARFLGDSLQQYFAVAGIFCRRVAIGDLKQLVRKINEDTSGVVVLEVRVSDDTLCVYPGFSLILKTVTTGKKVVFESVRNHIGIRKNMYR